MLIYLISILAVLASASSAAIDFSGLDKVMKEAMTATFPGAVVIVTDEKQVLYQKAYGYLTYKRDFYQVKTTMNTKYDIASVTKIMATGLAIMNLLGSKSIALTDLVSKYITNYDTNKKGNTTIANLLLHNAGLPYDFPGKLPQSKEDLIQGITFIKPDFPVGTKFQYSNLGFIMLGQIIEKAGRKSFVDYTSQNKVFAGFKDTGFNPPASDFYRCAPTEYDEQTRHEIVRGQAHERLAYLMNGVAGHSGYFTTAPDLSRYMRILLNKGKLPQESTRVLPESVIDLMTKRVEGLPYQNNMGYGFDTECPSPLMKVCFGHDGSTGILAWVDTVRKVTITLLSNRGHPDVNNGRFFGIYRQKISTAIIEAIDASRQ